jgi:ribosomal protein S18 acetylase RimI-like enzyme
MMTATRTLLRNERASWAGIAERRALRIRPATTDDFPAMLRIFRRVAESGDTCAHSVDTRVASAHAYWFREAVATYVAEIDGEIVGMYRIVENEPGRGSHVASASIMVDPAFRRQRLGRALGQHCLAIAKKDRFLAMQFNMVVSTNAAAIALLEKLGFGIVGRLPKAFRHARLGPVDAYVMHRSL